MLLLKLEGNLHEISELVELVGFDLTSERVSFLALSFEADVVCVWVVSENLSERRHYGCLLEAVRGVNPLRFEVTHVDVFVDFDDLARVRVFPAE